MNRSSIKTFFKRNGFKPDSRYSTMRAYRLAYCHKNGRHYRIRNNTESGNWCVDVSDLNFDRWANSTESYEMPIEDFIKSYKESK